MSKLQQTLISLQSSYRAMSSPTYFPIDSSDNQSEPSSPFLEKPQAIVARKTLPLRLLCAFLGMAVIVLSAIILYREVPHDAEELYHSPVPKFPYEIRRFTHDTIYSERPNPRSDAAWLAIEAPTYFTQINSQPGYIRVDGSQTWDGIEPGYRLANGMQKYGISMSHQIHCLGALRKIVFELLDGSMNITEFMDADKDVGSPTFVPNSFGVWHLTHCLDYLRQALQCAGDMSVEWPTYFNGEPIVVGWDIPHKCVAWNNIQRFMEENA